MQDNEPNLNELLKNIADELDIPDNYYEKTTERYIAIGKWLCRDESILKEYHPTIYPQGSFNLGTMIKPYSEDDEYDIDLVCELIETKDTITQKRLKELVGYEIKSYKESNGIKELVEEMHRCWRLKYSDEAKFHMDITPSIPEGESFTRSLISKSLNTYQSDKAIAICQVPEFLRHNSENFCGGILRAV